LRVSSGEQVFGNFFAESLDTRFRISVSIWSFLVFFLQEIVERVSSDGGSSSRFAQQYLSEEGNARHQAATGDRNAEPRD